jgi:hypothetical protein
MSPEAISNTSFKLNDALAQLPYPPRAFALV